MVCFVYVFGLFIYREVIYYFGLGFEGVRGMQDIMVNQIGMSSGEREGGREGDDLLKEKINERELSIASFAHSVWLLVLRVSDPGLD